MAFFAWNHPHQPTHPFWDFVASMENQPNGDFQRRGPPHHGPHSRGPHRGPPQHQRSDCEEPASGPSDKEQNEKRQPSVEDEQMTDVEARPAKRSMVDHEKQSGEENKATEGQNADSSSDEGWGHGRRGRHGGRRGWRGPGPFGPWDSPMFRPEFWNEFGNSFDPFYRGGPRGRRHGPPGPAGEHPPPPPPPEFDAQGPPPPPGPRGPHGRHSHHGPHTHHHGPHAHHHGPPGPPPVSPPQEAGVAGEQPPPPGFEPRLHHGRCGRGRGFGMRGGFGPRGHRGGPPFDLPGFLNHLSSQLGIDIKSAASNFGIDLSNFPGADRNGDADFVPAYDTFNLQSEFLVHISLPGAKKEDIGLDFDPEHNVLKVAGVAYRPGVDEVITSALVHNGRKFQVGVFEAKIPLSTDDTIDIDADSINAKLRDGILVIHIPKIQRKKDEKRTIPIATPSPSPSGSPDRLALTLREKAGESSAKGKEPETELDMYEHTPASVTEKGDFDDEGDDAMHEDPPEVLPAYTPVAEADHQEKGKEHDHEGYYDEGDEEEEGEYVRVNVD